MQQVQGLLEKTRVLNTLLQKTAGQEMGCDDISRELSGLMDTHVYIVNKKQEILGWAETFSVKDSLFGSSSLEKRVIDEDFNQWLLSFTRAEANVPARGMERLNLLIIPIYGGGERMGTIIFVKEGQKFAGQDILLAEYGGAVTGIEIMRSINQKIETETRKKAVVQLAIEVLSYSELEAVKYIFGEIQGNEGFLVASKLAEEYKLTRSVIVNALRKLESAGVIDARSLGMKGTYIKVLNDYLYDQLATV